MSSFYTFFLVFWKRVFRSVWKIDFRSTSNLWIMTFGSCNNDSIGTQGLSMEFPGSLDRWWHIITQLAICKWYWVVIYHLPPVKGTRNSCSYWGWGEGFFKASTRLYPPWNSWNAGVGRWVSFWDGLKFYASFGECKWKDDLLKGFDDQIVDILPLDPKFCLTVLTVYQFVQIGIPIALNSRVYKIRRPWDDPGFEPS